MWAVFHYDHTYNWIIDYFGSKKGAKGAFAEFQEASDDKIKFFLAKVVK